MNMKMFVLAALAMVPVAVRAQAQPLASAQSATGNLRFSDPPGVVRALAAAGYQAELGMANEGNPVISMAGRNGGGPTTIIFSTCANSGEPCQRMEFVAQYEASQSQGIAAAWTHAGGSLAGAPDAAALQPKLELWVDVPDAGLARAQFLAKLRGWSAAVAAFERMIDRTPGR